MINTWYRDSVRTLVYGSLAEYAALFHTHLTAEERKEGEEGVAVGVDAGACAVFQTSIALLAEGPSAQEQLVLAKQLIAAQAEAAPYLEKDGKKQKGSDDEEEEEEESGNSKEAKAAAEKKAAVLATLEAATKAQEEAVASIRAGILFVPSLEEVQTELARMGPPEIVDMARRVTRFALPCPCLACPSPGQLIALLFEQHNTTQHTPHAHESSWHCRATTALPLLAADVLCLACPTADGDWFHSSWAWAT